MGGCSWTDGITGDIFSTGGNGAHGDLAGGGAGLEDISGDFSFGPRDKIFAFFACRSALAPSLRTVGLGPIEVVGLGMNLGASLAVDICWGGKGSSFGSAGTRVLLS